MTRQPSRPTRRASGSSGAAGGLAGDRHRPRLPDTELGVDAFDHVAEALQRIESAGGDGNVEIGDGVSLHVSSLDKPYFPDDGVTKGGVMRYYAYLAAAILPSIADRPLVLRRYPARRRVASSPGASSAPIRPRHRRARSRRSSTQCNSGRWS
jgi:hypothetical protein